MRIFFMRLTKKTYLLGFVTVVLLLACIRWTFPQVAAARTVEGSVRSGNTLAQPKIGNRQSENRKYHKIRSVPNYAVAFPDTNGLQLTAANCWGVTPVANREDAESRKRELVYVGANPYYHVDPLYSSIPYLVPRAAVLLQDIGQAFFDSLYVKGVPLHKIIVTSVLRSQEDVAKLSSKTASSASEFLPPQRFRDMAAKTPIGTLPRQGRVVEGSDGWLISTHFNQPPVMLDRNMKPRPLSSLPLPQSSAISRLSRST